MDKRIWSTVIDSMLASDQNESAYSESIKFTKDYPSSGDAWRLLGRSAEKVDKPFEADKAWGSNYGKGDTYARSMGGNDKQSKNP